MESIEQHFRIKARTVIVRTPSRQIQSQRWWQAALLLTQKSVWGSWIAQLQASKSPLHSFWTSLNNRTLRNSCRNVQACPGSFWKPFEQRPWVLGIYNFLCRASSSECSYLQETVSCLARSEAGGTPVHQSLQTHALNHSNCPHPKLFSRTLVLHFVNSVGQPLHPIFLFSSTKQRGFLRPNYILR